MLDFVSVLLVIAAGYVAIGILRAIGVDIWG